MSPLFGSQNDPVSLFKELCRFHHLDKKTRVLLRDMMKKFKPDMPALVFVDDRWLRKASEDEEFQESVELIRSLAKDWFEDL